MSKKQTSRVNNVRLVGIGALTGVVALSVIFVALLLGLWLDSRMGQRGPMTALLLVLSVPISLFLMVRIALKSVGYILETEVSPADEETEEEA